MPVYKKNKKWYAVISYVGLNQKYKKVQSKYFDTKKEDIQAEIALHQKFKVTERYSITFEEAYWEFIERKKEQIKPPINPKTRHSLQAHRTVIQDQS